MILTTCYFLIGTVLHFYGSRPWSGQFLNIYIRYGWEEVHWIGLLFQSFAFFFFFSNGQNCHPLKKLILKVGESHTQRNKSDHMHIKVFVALYVNSLHVLFSEDIETLLDGNVDLCYTGKLTTRTIIRGYLECISVSIEDHNEKIVQCWKKYSVLFFFFN